MSVVPVYALFTKEQLAQMVQQRCGSKSDLARIEGIGENKINKYAQWFLKLDVRKYFDSVSHARLT